MKKAIISIICLAVFNVYLSSCAGINEFMEPKAKVTSSGGSDMQQAQAVAYNGPKARLAVSRFTDKSGKGWITHEIGDGMADMLATELFHSNRFIVLERQTINDILTEQDLGASGRIKKETAAPIGQIEGAELLITGAVTEFEPNASGVGGGLNSGHKGWGSVIAGIGGALKKSHVAIDIRIIDTKTSRILAATSVAGEARDASLGGILGSSHIGLGLGGYKNTPTEKAIRIAIKEAVRYISTQTPPQYYHCQ